MPTDSTLELPASILQKVTHWAAGTSHLSKDARYINSASATDIEEIILKPTEGVVTTAIFLRKIRKRHNIKLFKVQPIFIKVIVYILDIQKQSMSIFIREGYKLNYRTFIATVVKMLKYIFK